MSEANASATSSRKGIHEVHSNNKLMNIANISEMTAMLATFSLPITSVIYAVLGVIPAPVRAALIAYLHF